MTNGKHKLDCKCEWNDKNEVISFCGAHHAHHQKLIEPLIQDRARLEQINAYSKTQHPLISSHPCPLCEWDWEIDEKTGFGMGTHRKECGYHYALHELYKIKIVDEE